jgi:methionyl-tRNA formyltransferase
MDAGIDTGDMIMKEEVIIEPKETSGSLHDKLAECGGNLLLKALDAIENGTAPREKQKDEESNYAKMLDKTIGRIDFNKSAAAIERLIRGLNPWPSAYASLNGKTLKIWDADIIDEISVGMPGEILEVTKNAIIVKTGEGNLAIHELQLEGKNRMTAEAFLRGYAITKGTVLQ